VPTSAGFVVSVHDEAKHVMKVYAALARAFSTSIARVDRWRQLQYLSLGSFDVHPTRGEKGL
jgi:hypothetical protein